MSGVQPHSVPTRQGEWVIFATTAYPDQFVIEELRSYKMPFKQLVGKFDNQPESSWIVHSDDFETISWLAEGEDAVLILSDLDDTCPYRKAYIKVLATGRRNLLGWFVETGRLYAEKQSAFTHDPTQYRWWTVEKELPQPFKVKEPRIKLGPYNFDAEHPTVKRHVSA